MSAGLPAAGQRRRLALTGVPSPVSKGREFTHRALRDWEWDGTEAAEDALLLVSELLTNAALHAGGCRELVLTAGDTLRIEVYDGTTALPTRRATPQRGVPGGHGLYIVDRLSDRWGAQTHADGKAVWAEIDPLRLVSGNAVER